MKKAVGGFFLLLFLPFFLITFMIAGNESGGMSSAGGDWAFSGEYTEEVPIFKEVKGTGNISDEVAQLAVGTAVKYRLLPSVIISQWAYESTWGTSYVAVNDTNFFGITWFPNCGFPKGSARGVGGSEGGNYMKFPSNMACFSYYGYMVATQSNFNACVENKSPSDCLLILGRGGYAAAGITESSPYYTACMDIIRNNNLTSYDDFAISRWNTLPNVDSTNPGTGKGDLSILESQLGNSLYNGQCYGLTAFYVDKMGGPVLMNSGYENACDIGSDYNWEAYGWRVMFNPQYKDIQAGDIVNFSAGYGFAIPYGHTGVAKDIQANSVSVYDQWVGHGCTVSTYSRPITSIIRKVK